MRPMETVFYVLQGWLILTWANGQVLIKSGEMHMWNAAKRTCSSNNDYGMLLPFDDQMTSFQSTRDSMMVDQMYWVDGIIYNMGCSNGKCDVFYIQHVDKRTRGNLECISGKDSPKIDTNCSGSQLFNVSTITHVFKVSKILEDERTYIIGDFQVEGVRQDCFAVAKRNTGSVKHYYAPCLGCLFPAICLQGSETDSYVKTVTHRTVNESEIDDMMYNRPIPTTTKESFTIKDIRTSERTSMKHVSTAQTTAVFKSSSSGILTSHDLHQPSTLASETTASTFALSKQHEIEATLTVSTVIELKTESRLSLEVATRKRETMDKKPSDYGTEPKGDNYVVIVVVAILLLLMVLTAVGVTIWIKRQKEDMKRMRRTTRSEIWPDFTQQASVESSVGSVGIASPNVIFDNSMPNEHNRGHSN